MISAVVAAHDGLVRGIAACALRAAEDVTVTEAATAAELADACAATRADVVVTAPRLDVPVHPLVPDLLTAGRGVLLLTSDVNDPAVIAALVAGASGCVSVHDTDPIGFAEAALATASGRAVLHHDIAAAILDQWRNMRRTAPQRRGENAQLTRRELQVLSAIADGLTTGAVGRRLGIATKTVEAHKTRIFTKLGARDQAQAVTEALRSGVLAAANASGPAPKEVGRSGSYEVRR